MRPATHLHVVPAAGRGTRRRCDLLRSSANRVAVTSKPLRPVEKFGLPRSKEQRAPLLLPNLGRRSGVTLWDIVGHTGRRRARSTSSQDQAWLPAAATTRVDASSTSAASVHRTCSATQIHPRLARSASSHKRPSMRIRHHWIQQCTVMDDAVQSSGRGRRWHRRCTDPSPPLTSLKCVP